MNTETKTLKELSKTYTDGLEALKTIKGLLSKIQEDESYKLNDISLREDEGKINFKFCGYMMYAKLELKDRDIKDNMDRRIIDYFSQIKWGIYKLEGDKKSEEVKFVNNYTYTQQGWVLETEEENSLLWFLKQNAIQEGLNIVYRSIFTCLPQTLTNPQDES